jgi:hypothetical protein
MERLSGLIWPVSRPRKAKQEILRNYGIRLFAKQGYEIPEGSDQSSGDYRGVSSYYVPLVVQAGLQGDVGHANYLPALGLFQEFLAGLDGRFVSNSRNRYDF